MNTTLILMLMLPIIGAFAVYMKTNLNDWFIIPMLALPGMMIVGLAFFASHSSAVDDIEIWSGVVTAKQRVHDTYEKPYDCRCRTVTSGSGQNKTSRRECDTCYETRYTVKWTCDTTIGGFTLGSEDSAWRSVYNTPNPQRWTQVVIGEPAAKTHTYTNYIQAVPETLFKPISTAQAAKFAPLIPAYPDKIYDIYKIDRFVSPGFSFVDAANWNADISNLLITRGPKKQANLVVVAVKTDDPMYMYALRDAWQGANKNDIVLIMGSLDGQKIEWVDVISWTKSEIFKVELRDAVLELGVIDRTKIIPMVAAQIDKNFERRHMKEFEYLSNEIEPPSWALLLVLVVLCAGYGGVIWHQRR